MKLLGLKLLTKLKKKNKGNLKLVKAVDDFILDLKKAVWKSKDDVISDRKDADCVHNDGYYFFNINIHRTMALVEYNEGDDLDSGVAIVIWVGSHDEYERVFKNNKNTISAWLRDRGYIE